MNYSLISQSLVSRVGFRQPINPNEAKLHPDLIVSGSGLNVSGISEKYLSPDTISNCLVFFEGMEIPAYDSATNYAKDAQVKFDVNGFDQVYYSLQDGNLNHPYTDSEWWESALSRLLRNYRENAAKEVVVDAMSLHNVSTYAKKIIKSSPIFSENSKGKYLTPKGGFVGVRINMQQRQSLRMDIGKIGLKSQVAQTVTFYLYHSSQPDALQTYDIEITPDEVNRHVWKEIDLSIKYMDENVSAGGYYILGYYENENQLYGYDFEDYWACANCARYNPNYQLWDTYRSFFKITPVVFSSSKLDGLNLPNLPDNYNDIERGNQIHFNLSITVSCDPSSLIIQTLQVFDIAYQQKLALMILEDMMHSNRINDIADNARANIAYLLFGEQSQNRYVKGLAGEYKDSLKQISIDFSDMDVACFSNNAMLYEGRI